MCNEWQRAFQSTYQTSKKFGVYLQCIRSNLLDVDKVRAFEETLLLHRIQQSFRSKICTALYRNLTVSKNWLTIFEDVACVESSIHLEFKTTSNAAKLLRQNKKNKQINLLTAIIIMVALTNFKEPTLKEYEKLISGSQRW